MSISVVIVCFAEVFQDYLKSHFKEKECRIREAGTISEIMECAAAEALDVLLLDLTEERQRGLEIIRQIHANYSQIPIVVVVRKDDVQTSIAAMNSGAYDELSDPFDWNVLDSKIEAAFQEKVRKEKAAQKVGFFQKIEDYFAAAALAEQRSPEMARKIIAVGKTGRRPSGDFAPSLPKSKKSRRRDK